MTFENDTAKTPKIIDNIPCWIEAGIFIASFQK